MRGTVETIKRFRHKAYGFIKGNNDNMYYFNLAESLNSNTLSEGMKVDFVEKGDKATDVKQIH